MIYFLKKLLKIGNIPKRYDQLFDAVKSIKPINIMEIGVWTGERSRKMILLALKFRDDNQINYYGFDLFETMDEEKFKKEISKQPPSLLEVENKPKQISTNIHLFKGDTLKILPDVYKNLPKMDLVFIDGGHSLETIDNDWLYVSKLLHRGSVVIFDDYWPNRTDAGAKETVDSISRLEYHVEILPVTDHFSDTPFGPLTIQLAKVVKI